MDATSARSLARCVGIVNLKSLGGDRFSWEAIAQRRSWISDVVGWDARDYGIDLERGLDEQHELIVRDERLLSNDVKHI